MDLLIVWLFYFEIQAVRAEDVEYFSTAKASGLGVSSSVFVHRFAPRP